MNISTTTTKRKNAKNRFNLIGSCIDTKFDWKF